MQREDHSCSPQGSAIWGCEEKGEILAVADRKELFSIEVARQERICQPLALEKRSKALGKT